MGRMARVTVAWVGGVDSEVVGPVPVPVMSRQDQSGPRSPDPVAVVGSKQTLSGLSMVL